MRAEVASGSPKGVELSNIMKTGGLVSNQAVLELLAAAMVKIENAKGFLIDGYIKKKSIHFEINFKIFMFIIDIPEKKHKDANLRNTFVQLILFFTLNVRMKH